MTRIAGAHDSDRVAIGVGANGVAIAQNVSRASGLLP